MLSGLSRINGRLLPPAMYGGDGDGRMQWEPDHDYFDGRRGKELRQTRYWGTLQMGWSVLTRRQYIYIAQALRAQDPLDVVPATRHPERDAPSATEWRYEMEATSRLPLVGAPNAPGGYYSISVSLRTTSWVPERPSLEPTQVWAPDFSQHVDLFGGLQRQALSTGAQGWREDVSAYAGRLVRLEAQTAGEHVVRLLGAGGGVIATDPGQVARGSRYVTLPDGTRFIEVEAAARPTAHLDEDTFALTLEEQADGSYRLRALGRGYWRLEETITYTDRSGTTHTLGRRWALMPDALGQQRVKAGAEAGTILITHDT